MFNDFATWPCRRFACMDEGVCRIGMKGKKNISLKCYSMSWKAVRNLPNVHADLILNHGLWCAPFAMFYFNILIMFSLLHYKHPHDSHVSIVLNSCFMKPQWVIYRCIWRELVHSIERCIWSLLTQNCVFDLWPCYFISLNQRRNTKRDTCIFCKVENLIPIINHM